MKNTLILCLFLAVFGACKSKNEATSSKNDLRAIFPKTSWKSAENNKFPLYYQFTDSISVLVRDDSGEIPNMYESRYQVSGDTIRIEVLKDTGGSGAMDGYKQTLVYKDSALFLVSDQMPQQKVDLYSTQDKFIKE
jgi:hypothetical protein